MSATVYDSAHFQCPTLDHHPSSLSCQSPSYNLLLPSKQAGWFYLTQSAYQIWWALKGLINVYCFGCHAPIQNKRLWECIITESIGSNLAYLLHNWRLSVLQASSRGRKKVKVGTRVFLCILIPAVCDLPSCVTLIFNYLCKESFKLYAFSVR